MSFILDALKKLEQKKQNTAAPDIMTVHIPELKRTEKRPILLYLVLVSLILNIGILALWLYPTSLISPVPLNSAKENITTLKKQAPQSDNASEEPGKTLSSNTTPKEQPPAVKLKETVKVRKKPDVRYEETSAEQKLQNKPLAPNEQLHVGAGTITENGIPELNRLPAALQSEIPQIAIYGHIYSDSPATRLININGNILREGDTAAKNLKVEEITENGVVFNYQGTRFIIRAF